MLGGDPFRQKCFLGCCGVPRVTFLSSWRPRAGSGIVLVSATDLSGLCWRLALGAPTDAPGGSWPGCSDGCPRRLLAGGPWCLWGGPGEAQGAPGGGPGRHRNHRPFSEGVWGGSGGLPGVILASGVVLGTDLGDGNVDILFVLVVFLQRVCFSCFFVIFMSDLF